MNRFVAIVVLVLSGHSHALADTLGPLPNTPVELEFQLPHAMTKEPVVYVFRSSDELQAGLEKIAPKFKMTFNIEFEKYMVVGVTGRGAEPLAICRIELNNAANPSKLLVRTQRCEREPQLSGRVHFVVTPVSALPVKFLYDDMVDAGMIGMTTEGVESTVLGEVDGVEAAAKKTGIAVYREQAERLAVATLTETEIKETRKGLILSLRKRYPEPYSKISVERLEKKWVVKYDSFKFEVDAEDGKVTRPN